VRGGRGETAAKKRRGETDIVFHYKTARKGRSWALVDHNTPKGMGLGRVSFTTKKRWEKKGLSLKKRGDSQLIHEEESLSVTKGSRGQGKGGRRFFL